MDIYNPINTDPFADGGGRDTIKVHIRVQQRNARQKITTVSGIPSTHDLKALVKVLKKKLCCGGGVTTDRDAEPPLDKVLQFSGDQRQEIAAYLVKADIVEMADITIHGY